MAAGLTKNDIVHNAYGYGLFTGGLGAHYGAERIGSSVIPISGGNSDRQIMVMQDFGVTAICCTPSYFLHLIETAQHQGIDLREPLRLGQSDEALGTLIAEAWRARDDRGAEQRKEIPSRGVFVQLAGLKADPKREMHVRGG